MTILSQAYKRNLSIGLVLILSLAFLAKDLHYLGDHHHDPVCNSSDRHLHESEGHIDCTLCDFTFSPFYAGASHHFISTAFYLKNISFAEFLPISNQRLNLRLRGPPVAV